MPNISYFGILETVVSHWYFQWLTTVSIIPKYKETSWKDKIGIATLNTEPHYIFFSNWYRGANIFFCIVTTFHTIASHYVKKQRNYQNTSFELYCQCGSTSINSRANDSYAYILTNKYTRHPRFSWLDTILVVYNCTWVDCILGQSIISHEFINMMQVMYTFNQFVPLTNVFHRRIFSMPHDHLEQVDYSDVPWVLKRLKTPTIRQLFSLSKQATIKNTQVITCITKC